MQINLVAPAAYHSAFFGQSGLFGDVVIAMQFFNIGGDKFAVKIIPGAFTNPVAGVNRRLAVSGIGA
jgi:hypothetical protein